MVSSHNNSAGPCVLDDDCLGLVLAFVPSGSREAFLVSHLSRRLRSLALLTPTLWSHLTWWDQTIYDVREHQTMQSAFYTMLHRAGPTIDLSLEIHATRQVSVSTSSRSQLPKALWAHNFFERVVRLALFTNLEVHTWSPGAELTEILQARMPRLTDLNLRLGSDAPYDLHLNASNLPTLQRLSARGRDSMISRGSTVWPHVRFAELAAHLFDESLGDILAVFPNLDHLKLWEKPYRWSYSSSPMPIDGHALRRLDIVRARGHETRTLISQLGKQILDIEELGLLYIVAPFDSEFTDILGLAPDPAIGTQAVLLRVSITGNEMVFPGTECRLAHAEYQSRVHEEHGLGIYVSLSHTFADDRTRVRRARTPHFGVAVNLTVAALRASARQYSPEVPVEVEMDSQTGWRLLFSACKRADNSLLAQVERIVIRVPSNHGSLFPMPRSIGIRASPPVPKLKELVFKSEIGGHVRVPADVLQEFISRFADLPESPQVVLIGVLVENMHSA